MVDRDEPGTKLVDEIEHYLVENPGSDWKTASRSVMAQHPDLAKLWHGEFELPVPYSAKKHVLCNAQGNVPFGCIAYRDHNGRLFYQPKPLEQRDELIARLYVEHGWPQKAIADALSVSIMTVNSVLQEWLRSGAYRFDGHFPQEVALPARSEPPYEMRKLIAMYRQMNEEAREQRRARRVQRLARADERLAERGEYQFRRGWGRRSARAYFGDAAELAR